MYPGIVCHYIWEAVVKEATSKVGSYLDWSISDIPTNKTICSKFGSFYIPFYECIFLKLGV